MAGHFYLEMYYLFRLVIYKTTQNEETLEISKKTLRIFLINETSLNGGVFLIPLNNPIQAH